MIILAWAIRSEADLEDKIKSILERFSGQKFNDVTIAGVRRQYEVDGRKADIALLKDDNKPLLIIETKKKYERDKGWKIERRFIPTSEEVVGQAVSYVALLKCSGVYVPFVATANDRQLALFMVPENVEEIVDWDAISRRDYGNVIKDFYNFKNNNLILHKPHGPYSEEFFKELLDIITGIYAKKYSVGEKRQEWHWLVLEDLRSFIEFLTPFIEEAIAQDGGFKENIASKLEEYQKRTGYSLTPQQLAREMAYILMNKIIFYKVLERYYNLPRLDPLYEKGVAKTCSEYLRKLRECFSKAVEVTRDFQAVFETGIYDEVDVIENEEVLRAIDWIIRYIERYEIERLGDVVGFIYEELIPAEERHQLGQFYTPKPIAELITKWCIRSPGDKVLDPGCGSGTFLVEAYKRLAELKLKKPWSQVKHVPGDVHRQILRQLYGVDINEFPAHLTAINLAMKNVRAPSPEMYIFVRDYFTIISSQSVLAPYKIRTAMGEKPLEVTFKDFDAVVGNPPYTRWGELSREIQSHIATSIGGILGNYDLIPQAGRRGAEYNMVVFWIAHSISFLKEGGRLGMIISDSWLQTAYGVRFGRLLGDHFKIHAVIDISSRVFPVPLIGSCIVFLEKNSNEPERDNNEVAFVYLNIKKGGIDVQRLLKLIEEKKSLSLSTDNYDVVIRIRRQSDIKKSNKLWIQFLFDTEHILAQLGESKFVKRLSDYFEPTYGNILYTILYTRRIARTRHAGVGGDDFFYLSEESIKRFNIPQEYLYLLVANARDLPYFTFTKEDWESLKRSGAKCYLFICHKPRNELPQEVLSYIQFGETEIKLTKGIHKGEPVSRSRAAEERRRLKQFFFDWYDLGGVIPVPVVAPRYARYWHRFALVDFNVAFSDDFITFIPHQNANLDEKELKALLAYLNSSIAKLYLETYGRTAGGVALLALESRELSEIPILNVKNLPSEEVEKMAQLFDKLELETRKLGGADEAENVFGSELAVELTGRGNVKSHVKGLFNTVIKEIDYELARILGLESIVETIRSMVVELTRRRLSRAGEAKREAVRGTEELLVPRKPKKKRSMGDEAEGKNRKLDEFMG